MYLHVFRYLVLGRRHPSSRVVRVAQRFLSHSMALYVSEPGACRGGFDLVSSSSAIAARSEKACAEACVAHGSECVSASWWKSGLTALRNSTIRSQCFLSSSCAIPNCCFSGFRTQIKREHAAVQIETHANGRLPVVDAVQFNDELHVLRYRMQLHAPFVDIFVVCETATTFRG